MNGPVGDDGGRIAKALARAGLCSRREAERWIAEGRVAINGAIIHSPAINIGEGDSVAVDGVPLPTTPPLRMWRYHKPPGLITTHADPQGRPTIFAQLPKEFGRVLSVGRLDVASEGLLLLTNRGAVARHLELPATGWKRRYRVRAHGVVDAAALKSLAAGVTVDGVHYGPIEASLDRVVGSNCWLAMTLTEGKNREVRNVLAHLGLQVTRLIRISVGPFQLGSLLRGGIAEIPARVLRGQLGAFAKS